MIFKTILLLILGVSLFSCSSSKQAHQKLNTQTSLEQELRYSAASDTLDKYRNLEVVTQFLETDTIISDFPAIDYSSYKEKYKLDDSKMNFILFTVEMIFPMIKADLSINENTRKAEELRFDKHVMDTTSIDYSFNRIIPLGTNHKMNSSDSSILILMQAFDSDTLR